MNATQRRLLNSWPPLLWTFTKREWFATLLASGAGIFAAECAGILARDRSVRSYLTVKYAPAVRLEDPRQYVAYALIAASVIAIALAPALLNYTLRALRSWWAGVTTGLVFLPFVTAFSACLAPASRLHHRFAAGTAAVMFWFSLSFVLFLLGAIRAGRTIQEEEFTVRPTARSLAGSNLADSDDPIQSWEQDALGRAALVDALSVKLMIGRTPVIALSGPFGSGKTSTLNLLSEHLQGKAIVVLFSSWLPGSEETLTSYLLADIANECAKLYVTPGLRQGARRLARVLGQRVPMVSDYLKLLPSGTQRDDIFNLQSALSRLPKRVIVLLDEIDRMEKDELVTLLKVIRGISILPNVSFVCAGDRQTIVETVKGEFNDKKNAYFDKFFPVSVEIPDPDPAALRKAGTERLAATFAKRDWFENDAEKDKFKATIEQLWDARIAPFCRNLRAIGLLANEISLAAASLRREVDAADLTLVEVLHRFKPTVYRLVATNGVALTGGEGIERGGPPQLKQEKATNRSKFLDGLKAEIRDEGQLQHVKGILYELFPLLSKADAQLDRLLP